MPLECYCIKKKDFYEYLSDITKKQFLKYIRAFPKDKDLRRFYYEQTNWHDFKSDFVKERVSTPLQIRRDPKRM